MSTKPTLDKFFDQASRLARETVNRVAQSRPAIFATAGLLVTASVALLLFALREPAQSRPSVASVESSLETTSTPSLRPRALDGVLVDASSTRLLPIGVVVENSADAWPLAGPAKADLVFEAPVEGSITRYLLFFDASTTAAEIGPVRSARPYFVDWTEGLGAMYAHVGGSPAALNLIAGKKTFRDLNEYWNGWAFWRAARRAAPHNVFTRTELLLQAAGKKAYVPGDFRAWYYRDAPTSTSAISVTSTITVPYECIYRASWKYDSKNNDYIRYRNGKPLTDADGSTVRAKNVILLQTDATVLDDVGRLKLRTTGTGKALIYRDGEKTAARWSRSAGENIRFVTIEGADVPLARGKTWISVVTSAEAFGESSP